MPTEESTPRDLITEAGQLEELADQLMKEPQIALDTESNSLYAYQERVCLLQVSSRAADYLVDPIALPDLQPLDRVLRAPQIEKVLHGAEYDLACLKRDFGFTLVRLFDTRLALRTLGISLTSLADALGETFGIRIDKRYQRADWGKRPLPGAQLDYARQDTRYLLRLRDHLAQALLDAGRWEEASEAFAHLACTVHVDSAGPTEDFWSVTNSRSLAPRQAGVLRELFRWRDRQARALDRPPFKVLGDDTLMAIARSVPTTRRELAEQPGMTSRLVERHADALLAAVEQGLQAPHPRPPSATASDPAVVARFDVLRRWRKKAAAERGVESDIILPREVLWEVARQAPRDLATLERLLPCLPWRCQAYGPAILRALGNGS